MLLWLFMEYKKNIGVDNIYKKACKESIILKNTLIHNSSFWISFSKFNDSLILVLAPYNASANDMIK